TKSVLPGSISEGGVGNQTVTYTYVITNTSPASTDPVTLTSVIDDKVGNLLAAAIAANGGSAVLAPGASVTFTATQTLPVANAAAVYDNTVTATGHDDENDTASNSATARVTYTDVTPRLSITKTVAPGSIS